MCEPVGGGYFTRSPLLYTCRHYLLSAPCASSVVDLVFVVDSSGSICDTSINDRCCPRNCDNWDFVKEFLARVAGQLVISEQDAHIGLVLFSSDVRVVLRLDR